MSGLVWDGLGWDGLCLCRAEDTVFKSSITRAKSGPTSRKVKVLAAQGAYDPREKAILPRNVRIGQWNETSCGI